MFILPLRTVTSHNKERQSHNSINDWSKSRMCRWPAKRLPNFRCLLWAIPSQERCIIVRRNLNQRNCLKQHVFLVVCFYDFGQKKDRSTFHAALEVFVSFLRQLVHVPVKAEINFVRTVWRLTMTPHDQSNLFFS